MHYQTEASLNTSKNVVIPLHQVTSVSH